MGCELLLLRVLLLRGLAMLSRGRGLRAILLPAHELSMLSYRLSCAIACASRAFVSDGSIKVTKGNSYKMLLATTFGSRF